MTKIYVNADIIGRNRGLPFEMHLPPIAILKEGERVPKMVFHASIIGNDGVPVAEIVYDPHAPNKTVWIETKNEIV